MRSAVGASSISKQNISTSSFTGKSREDNLGVSGRWCDTISDF